MVNELPVQESNDLPKNESIVVDDVSTTTKNTTTTIRKMVCDGCHYTWNFKGHMLCPTCPSCMKKVKRINTNKEVFK